MIISKHDKGNKPFYVYMPLNILSIHFDSWIEEKKKHFEIDYYLYSITKFDKFCLLLIIRNVIFKIQNLQIIPLRMYQGK